MTLLAHVVLARTDVESSIRKAMTTIHYHILTLGFYIEFTWLGTREDAARHLQTLIEPSTFDHQRWMKEQNISLTTTVETQTKAKHNSAA